MTGVGPERDDIGELRRKMARGRMAIREAIEFVASDWEFRHQPRPGETEVWSARETAEHAISTELWFAGLVAAVIGVSVAATYGIDLPTPADAEIALDEVSMAVDSVYGWVAPVQLDLETEVGRTVASVMRWSAWHLHEHAKQMVGVQ
jgi:hypothetical protein